jgi:hypothetical protein
MKFALLRLFLRLVFPKDVVVRNATIKNGILTLPPQTQGLIADSTFTNTRKGKIRKHRRESPPCTIYANSNGKIWIKPLPRRT